MSLKNIFEPNSIAIIGASNNIKKWGGNILFNLMRCGYKGKIYPINPKEFYVQEFKSYSSVLDVPNNIDLAIIVVPSNLFISVLHECGEKGIKGIIGITAGFKEIGNKDLEDEVVKVLNQYGMRMIGPNCMGILNLDKNINVSVVQQTPKLGGISFICQSGTMGIALIEDAVRNGVGLNKVISTGNKANIDDIDLLEYLNKDESTKVIVIYAESINRGKEFINIAKKIKKPIVILKAGRSQKGAKAAFSHTGSMSGSDDIYSVAFKQSGVIRVDAMEELFDAAIAFSQPISKGNRIGIVANGGGAGIVVSDLCEKYGIELPEFEQNTKDEIKKVLRGLASANNPIDTAADNRYDTYYHCIHSMILDSNIDAMIVIYVHTQLADAISPANAVMDASQVCKHIDKIEKPILTCFFGGPGYEKGVKTIESKGIPNYITPERAIRALNYLLSHKKALEKKI